MSRIGGLDIDSFASEIDRLENEVLSGRRLPEFVYRLHVSQGTETALGHVWIVHVHRNGTFDWYRLSPRSARSSLESTLFHSPFLGTNLSSTTIRWIHGCPKRLRIARLNSSK